MKAILVKYLPATNTKPARAKAIADGVKPVIHATCGDFEGAAKAAAYELCETYGWGTKLVSGGLPNGDIVFCFK